MIDDKNLGFELIVRTFPGGFLATIILSDYVSRPSVSSVKEDREKAISSALEKANALLKEIK